MSDEQQIRDLIQRWAAAVHTGDLPAVLADHASEIVMFDVPPPQQGVRGIDAYRDTWPGFFEWQAAGAVFEIESLEANHRRGRCVRVRASPLRHDGRLRSRRRLSIAPHRRPAQNRRPLDRDARTPLVRRHDLVAQCDDSVRSAFACAENDGCTAPMRLPGFDAVTEHEVEPGMDG